MEYDKSLIDREKNKKSIFIILWFFYFIITLILFYNQAIHYKGGYPSDIDAYILQAFGQETGLPLPYPLLFWFIRFFSCFTVKEFAAALAVAILNGLTPLILFYYWNSYIKKLFLNFSCNIGKEVILFSLLFVTSIIATKFNPNLYLGQGSPNTWHNATILATRPFAVATFFSFLDVWKNYKKQIEWKKWFFFGAVLFLSTFTKPSFAFIFIPTVGLLLLYDLIKEKGKCIKNSFIFGCSFIPTFLLLLYQYFITFYYYGGEGGIGIKFGYVWGQYSPNIIISIILALLFPMIIIIWNYKEYKKDNIYILAIGLLVTSLVQALLFYEKGPRIWDGNFLWGYYHGIFFVFVTSSIIFIQSFFKKNIWYRIIGVFSYSLHFICGIYYFVKVFQGLSYK